MDAYTANAEIEDITMTNELKPCPFCGKPAKQMRSGLIGHFCGVLGIDIRVTEHVWNTRYKRTCHVSEDRAASEAFMGLMLRCSECNAVFPPINGEYRFCPNCGAEVIDG